MSSDVCVVAKRLENDLDVGILMTPKVPTWEGERLTFVNEAKARWWVANGKDDVDPPAAMTMANERTAWEENFILVSVSLSKCKVKEYRLIVPDDGSYEAKDIAQ